MKKKRFLKDGCVFLCILVFFCKKKKKQNLSIIVSICPIVSWVGAFESLDDEATFFILLYGDATYGKFSRDPQSCQLLLILWFILRNLYKMLVFSTYTQTGDKSGAEAPGPSGFPISFNEFTNVFISAFIKWFRIFLFRSSWVTKG